MRRVQRGRKYGFLKGRAVLSLKIPMGLAQANPIVDLEGV